MKYEPKQLKPFSYKYLPLGLIQIAFEQGFENQLGYFIRLASLKRKPVHYNFTYADLSKKIGCSPATLHRALHKLISLDLASIRNGNLYLKSTHALKAQYKTTLVPIKIYNNKQDQLTYLRQTLIRRKLHLQHKANKLRQNILDIPKADCKLSISDIKLTRKKMNDMPQYKNAEIGKLDYLMLSNKSFGKLCNRSARTGVKIQKDLNRLKLIKSERNIVMADYLPNYRAFREKYISNNYQLSKHGIVFQILPNKITVR